MLHPILAIVFLIKPFIPAYTECIWAYRLGKFNVMKSESEPYYKKKKKIIKDMKWEVESKASIVTLYRVACCLPRVSPYDLKTPS